MREIYRLLVDSSAPIRHAAAELVAGMLEEQGQRFIAQVRIRPLGRCHSVPPGQHQKHNVMVAHVTIPPYDIRGQS